MIVPGASFTAYGRHGVVGLYGAGLAGDLCSVDFSRAWKPMNGTVSDSGGYINNGGETHIEAYFSENGTQPPRTFSLTIEITRV
jgi:hypothetical protein